MDLKDQFIGIIIRYFTKNYAENENIRVDASFQGVSKLFVLAYQRGNDNYVNEKAFNK